MNREEMIPFLKALLSVAKADNDVDRAELSFFQQLSMELGFTSSEFSNIQTSVLSGKGTFEEYLDGISERGTKLQLLYRMMQLSCSDGRIDDAEVRMIDEAAEHLGIDKEKVEEIQELVKESEELRVKTNRVLECED